MYWIPCCNYILESDCMGHSSARTVGSRTGAAIIPLISRNSQYVLNACISESVLEDLDLLIPHECRLNVMGEGSFHVQISPSNPFMKGGLVTWDISRGDSVYTCKEQIRPHYGTCWLARPCWRTVPIPQSCWCQNQYIQCMMKRSPTRSWFWVLMENIMWII